MGINSIENQAVSDENMNEIKNKKVLSEKIKVRLISIIISIIVGICVASVLNDAGAFRRHVKNKCATTNENYRTGDITSGKAAIQPFTPAENNLASVDIRLDTRGGECSSGMVVVSVLENAIQVVSVEIPMTEVLNDNWTTIPLNVRLDTAKQYLLEISTTGISGDENAPMAIYRPIALDRIDENTDFCAYNGEIIPGGCLAIGYDYVLQWSFWEVITYEAFFAFVALIIISGIIYISGSIKGKGRDPKDNGDE